MNIKLAVIAVVAVLVVAGAGAAIFFINNKNGDSAIDLVSNDVHLDIFGNADGNSRIDDNDVKIIQDYIDGKVQQSDLLMVTDNSKKTYYIADANLDGVVDSKDVDYVKTLIDRTAKKVNFLDGYGIPSSCRLKIDKVVSEYTSECEMLSLLGVQDKIVSVGNAPYQMKDYFLKNMKDSSKVYNLSNMHSPDYDKMGELAPDVWITHLDKNISVKKTKSTADVFSPNLTNIDLVNPYNSGCVKGALLLGYIFDNTPAAEKYVKWIVNNWNTMTENTKKIAEADKPSVLYFWHGGYLQDSSTKTLTINAKGSVGYQALNLVGGHAAVDDIAPNLLVDGKTISIEKIVEVKADYMFDHTVKYQGDGKELTYIPSQGYLVDDPAELKAFQDNIRAIALFDSIADDHIYVTCNELWHGGSGGIILAAQIGHILYPDTYSEEYLNNLLQEYVELMGYDYDSSKHGVFWYF